MKVRLKNNEGSGSVAFDSPSTYSFMQDVTSLQPANLTGGSGQVNVSAIASVGAKVGNAHPDSKFLINNSMSLVHEDGGEIEFRVKQATISDNAVSLIGSTLESRLNVERTAGPHGGSGYTLLSAIIYYCRLVEIYYSFGNVANFASLPATPNQYDGYVTTDTGKFYVYIGSSWTEQSYQLFFDDSIDTQLNNIAVNFIGWRGNVWEHLKMLCAAVSISTTDNVGFEFYTDQDGLHFRQAKTTSLDIRQEVISSQSVSIDSFDAAQELRIYNYNTSYKTNSVVQDISGSRQTTSVYAQGATTEDSLQVNAGETLVKRFTINASLETINQPIAVDSILPFPYTGGTGQYCISGADGKFIKAAQWIGEGGKLTVALTENPNEIEVTITAPVKNGLENVTGGGALSFEPYKIGVESAGNIDYPAIYVTGTGVFYSKVEHAIKTGASSQYTSQVSAPQIDNPFVTSTSATYSRGAAAAQSICGPNVTLTETYASNEPFGTTPGKLRTFGNNSYRINTVNYGVNNTTVTASPSSTFTQFNSKWSGKTFTNFKDYILDPITYPDETLKFNEFTVMPLMSEG